MLSLLLTDGVIDTKETVKPIIVDSADEEPFENEEVYDEDYSPSIPLEEDEDETDEKPQQ